MEMTALHYRIDTNKEQRRSLALLVAVALSCILAIPFPADRSRAAERREKPETRRVQTVSVQTAKYFTSAQEMLGEEKYPEALSSLDKIKERGNKLNDYEKALMYQLYGYVYAGQEKYEQATESFEKSLSFGALQEAQTLSLKYALGQLYIANGNYKKGIAVLEDWLKTASNPGPSAYMSLASAYLQTENPKRAIVLIEEAFSQVDAPQENWLNIAFAAYYQVNDYNKCANILEQLVERYPKKNYFIQLSAIYGSLKRDKQSLSVMEAAYDHGYLTKDSEILRLTEMMLYNELPYKAGEVLEKGITDGVVEKNERNWYLLGNAWMQAKEFDRAEQPLREAAKRSNDGKTYRLLGQLAYEKEAWRSARESLELALEKGGFENEGQVYLMLGLVNMNLEDYALARKAFQEAAKDKQTRDPASRWLKHLAKLSS